MYLITHNKNKIHDFKSVLEPEINLDVLELEYPELRSDEGEEIVALAAKQLSDQLNKTIIVEDSGFHIKALSGFPGTCTAYVHKRIENKGFLRLMALEKNREIYYKSAIAYCKPNSKPVIFTGIEHGTMATEERGDQGWGQDPIFIPDGSDLTYGEHKPDVNLFRLNALKKLKKFLLNNSDTTIHSQ